MGSMTDERRKEMEEEMMRFEQEISFPADEDPHQRPLRPPPAPPKLGIDANIVKEKFAPPATNNIIPEVFSKPPPPPPPLQLNVGPDQHMPLMPPPMPHMHGPTMDAVMQFIPHQLQRQPPRPPRPGIIHLRGPPAFHGPGPMPFPMQGHLFPPMHPHPMSLPPMGMPMPMGPGFCPPPPPPGMAMGPMPGMHMGMPPQPFMPPPMSMPMHEPTQSPKKREIFAPKETKQEPDIASAPAVYAAPPTKSLSDTMAESSAVTNGQVGPLDDSSFMISQQVEEPKTVEERVTVMIPSTPVQVISEAVTTKKEKKKKKAVRMAGGQAWEDNSLTDWDPDDFRIFCGDLGNDVTDEVLIRAFSKYTSFVKAKVIRDKRTNKTKGYGFVSFKDPQDFIKAMREMNGRYVGSRPIKLRKSTWKDRNIEIVRKKQKEKEKLGLL